MAKIDLSNFDKIIVLDFGSQYNQLITRRIRDFGIYSELLPHTITAEEVKQIAPKGIIFSGGPNSVYDENALDVDPEIFELGIPILGICYGMQLMTQKLGGTVEKAGEAEYGSAHIEVKEADSPLYKGLPEKQVVWMSHGDLVTKVPEGFEVLASSKNCPIASMADPARKFYAIQFHAEVRNSEYGLDILRRFAFDVCGAKDNWTMDDFIKLSVDSIREEVGDANVILGISGGVDSSVTATLLHKAIGSQLTAIFVDHGLLRKNESDEVMAALKEGLGVNIVRVDAKDRFMSKLAGVTDPEKKRKIIGNEFVQVFNDEAKKIKDAKFLGEKLGLPHDLVWRQPFPGPGLAIRVIGEITEEKLRIVRDADAILREEVKNAGLQESIWQYFVALPGMRSVGVMGDGRTYDYAVCIRAVTSIDGMTADFAQIPWDVLQKISVRIVNEVKQVNRVLYDVTSKPPATIEYE